jgi:hypothetical protein
MSLKDFVLYLTLAGAAGALTVLIYSMFVDAARHQDCACPAEDDPSYIWYPVRWGLVCLLSLVAVSSFNYLSLREWVTDITLLVNLAAVALGWTYGLTLLNPKLSITWVAEEVKRRLKALCSR